MSQTATTPITNKNPAPITVSKPVLVPIVPMFLPNGNINSPRQQYLVQTVYPNGPAYLPSSNHRFVNIGPSCNTPYAPFYSTSNNMLSASTHIPNLTTFASPYPLMNIPILPSQQLHYPPIGSPTAGNDFERNQNLNIRECQSPTIDPTNKSKIPLCNVNSINNNADLDKRQYSLHVLSPKHHSESDLVRLPSTSIQEVELDDPQDDFLTFIEQKTKTKCTMPELNPFANEFSFNNNKIVTKDSVITSKGIDLCTTNENQSSYRVLFDHLIEKSLESIEVIKNSKKKVAVTDAFVQCNQISDSSNRSTQTIARMNNSDLLEEYSLSTVKLMNELVESFPNIYHEELHNECKTLAHTCDELHHLVLLIHHITSLSSHNHHSNSVSMSPENPFSRIIQDVVKDAENRNQYRMTSQMKYNAESGTPSSMKSSTSLTQSFSSRHVDQVEPVQSKLCSICQTPLDHTDNIMHIQCQLLLSGPNISSDT